MVFLRKRREEGKKASGLTKRTAEVRGEAKSLQGQPACICCLWIHACIKLSRC